MPRLRALAVPLVLAALMPATAAAQAPVTDCPAVAPTARCGTLDVPLDHSGGVPGTQTLGFAVLPATGARTGTLAVQVGGPGQAATEAAGGLSVLLTRLRATHDLLLVDQRGTGRSGRLTCPALQRGLTPATVRECGEALGDRRAFLSSRTDAQDLEAVRGALGLEKLSLLAVSYGTGVAGYYARLFPERVERMVLDSPQPIEGADPLMAVRQLALPRVLREVCWPPSCGAFLTREPVTAVAALAAKLRRGALRGTVITAAGRARSARFTSTDLYALTVASDLDPFLRTRLPSAVAAALRGDEAPILRLTRGIGEPTSGGVNPLRLLATECLDDRLPWTPDSPVEGRVRALAEHVAARPAAQFAPFSPTAVLALSVATPCTAWPSTQQPGFVPQQGPPVPVLVVSGRDDLRTPLEDARRTAAQYPRGAVLAVPDTGHSVIASDLTLCAVERATDFLNGQEAVAPCPRVERTPDLFPYVPANLANIKPAAGLTGNEGRTATAVGVTLVDAIRRAVLTAGAARRSGGLRAGTLTVTSRRVRLTGYSLVRGVTLTGTLPATRTGTGTLVVGGTAAAPGRLTLKGTRLTGTLGTKKVRLRVALP